MDDQREPDLEKMDEGQAQAFLGKLYSALSAEREHALRTPPAPRAG